MEDSAYFERFKSCGNDIRIAPDVFIDHRVLSLNEPGTDIVVADFQAVERMAGAGILLHHEPLATGGFSGSEDRWPVEIAAADFHHGGSSGDASIVLQVENGEAVFQAGTPFHRGTAPMLNPIGIQFETLE